MKHLAITLFAVAAALVTGCQSPTKEDTFAPRPPTREVLRAESLFNNGQVRDAVFACVDIARKDPDTAGLADLQTKIQRFLAAHRTASFETVNGTTHEVAMSDVKRYQNIPMTFNQRKHVLGFTDPLKNAPSDMRVKLETPVDLVLENADLNTIVDEIARSSGINIIADNRLGADDEGNPLTVTVRMTDVALIELLEFLGRNMGVAFHVGNNMIWVTAADENAGRGAPMETRVYRLRKGLGPMEMRPSQGPAAFSTASSRNGGGGGGGGGQQGQPEPSVPMLIDALTRFVTQPDGADMMWDDKAHALLLKNTRENLRLSEDIIEAMDVAPVQISIAARFMTVDHLNTRKLGVDWLLDNQKGGTPAGFLLGNKQTSMSNTLSLNRAGSRTGETNRGNGNASNERSSSDFSGGSGGWTYSTTTESILGGATSLAASSTSSRNSAMSTTITSSKDINNLANSAVSGIMGSSGGDFLYQTILGKFAMQAVVHALEESGRSETLAMPRVTTMNNHEAQFRKGEDFRFFENYDLQNYSSSAGGYGNGSSSSGTSLVPTGTPTIEELGYTLTVTPSVGADYTSINLRLRPEISAFKGWEYYSIDAGSNAGTNNAAGTMKLPIFLRSLIDTQVTVRSGETIILGGMIDSYQSVSTRGVPFLSSLPFIGRLFKTETKENVPSNLLIFVTATIISETGEELISINPQNLPGLPVPEDYYATETDDAGEFPAPADGDGIEPIPEGNG